MAKLEQLIKYIESDNIAADLDDELLSEIGGRVIADYEIDLDSCSEWLKVNEEAIKMAKQVKEEKNFPWRGAANVKYPLITVGSIQFASRASQELINDNGEVVKTRVIGDDPDGKKHDRAERVASFMSYQFLEEQSEWEEDTDRLLHVLPNVGCLHKKVFYNALERKNESLLLLPNEFVVHIKTKNLKTCRRGSHVLKFYKNDIYERQMSGSWLDIELGEPIERESEDDSPHVFIEQHRFWDLDEDGYAEPYIVTVHKESQKVVRIVARYSKDSVEVRGERVVRIVPEVWFVKYGFIPNPDGSYLDVGFGQLLSPINEAVNTTLNELLDAGAAHNAGGGFLGRGVNVKAGQLNFQLNEWKTVESNGQSLKDSIVPLPTREPSQVLFMLLGTLIEAGKDISSIKNVLMGEKPGENVSAELYVSMVDQGLKEFSAIFKRIYRSLKREFKLHYKLNGEYLDEVKYYTVLDKQLKTGKEDFNYTDCDIIPVADPNLSLDVQRMGRANLLKESMGMPGLKPMAITKRWLDAMKIPNQEEIFDPQQAQQPDPNVEKMYLEMGMMKDKHELEKQEIFSKIMENIAKSKKLHTACILDIAKAESEEIGPQLEEYKTYVQELGVMIKGQESEYKRLNQPTEK